MFQAMQHLLQKGVNPKNILYFSFDEERIGVEKVLAA